MVTIICRMFFLVARFQSNDSVSLNLHMHTPARRGKFEQMGFKHSLMGFFPQIIKNVTCEVRLL